MTTPFQLFQCGFAASVPVASARNRPTDEAQQPKDAAHDQKDDAEHEQPFDGFEHHSKDDENDTDGDHDDSLTGTDPTPRAGIELGCGHATFGLTPAGG
jgi:hypothetical protein